MASKQVMVEVAEFLESSAAREMVAVPRDVAKRIVEGFVSTCYEGLGKAPRWIDAEDVRTIVVERLPGQFTRKDASVEHVPVVLSALVEHVAATTVMSQAFEVRRALPAACEELIAIVSAGRNVPEAPARQDPFVHGASKLGRNDPCSCGSGKKYKKCHGKEA